MKGKNFTQLKIAAILLLIISSSIDICAEKRYYFASKVDLPSTVGLETVDMRPNNGRSVIELNNLTSNDNIDFVNFDKPSSSWWSFNQTSWGAPTTTDMSDINGNWYLKFKIKTTITSSPINIILNNSGTTNCIKLTSNLPRNGTWTEFTYKLSNYPTTLTYSTYAPNPFFQMHSDNADAGTYLALEYVYLTNVDDAIPAGGRSLSANKVTNKITFTDNTSTLTLASGVVLTVDSLIVPIAADGSAPQIVMGANAQITAGKYVAEKKVASDKWSVLSVPFNFSTSNIKLKSSGVAANPGVDLSLYKTNTNIFAANYPTTPENVWQPVSTETTINTALTAARNTGVSYAVTMKMDPTLYPAGETLVVSGTNVVLSGVDKTLTTVWASGAINVENFNFVGTPFLSNYTGVITSPNSTAGGRIANLGMTTYTYNPITDNYFTNVPCLGAATYHAYDAIFCQAYENTSAPYIPILSTSAVYNVQNQYKIGIDGIDQVNIIESTGANSNFTQNEDGVKLFGMNASTSAIYALDGSGVKMSVSAVPSIPTQISLGIKSGVAGSHTISVISPVTNKSYTLKDNVTSIETDITSTPYTFTTSTTGLINDRFVLKIHTVINITGNTAASTLTTCTDCNVNILTTGILTIDTPINFKTITVEPGGKLTNTESLTATTLNLHSDATGMATYVDKGISTITTANVQQYLASARNWYVSSPMKSTDVPTGSIYFGYQEPGNNTDLEGVSGATAYWKPYRAETSLTAGKGYIAQPSGETTLEFSGTLNTGSISTDVEEQPTLTRTGSAAKPGFNLVGNPYPSYVNWNAATKTNLETTYWYRTKTALDPILHTTSYVFDTYNTTGNQHTDLGATTVSNLIPPMQAFWVRVAEGHTSGTLAFSNEMREHADVSGNTIKAPSTVKSDQKVLKLQVTNGINKDEAIVYFDSNALNSFDAFDSYKMSNANATIPEIYTIAGKEQLVINGLNSISSTEEMPLGFTTGQAGTFTIKASEINNFDTDAQIILKDKLLNLQQELTPNSAYNFMSDISSNANRFSLIFKSGVNISGVNEPENNLNVSVFKNANNQITVKCSTNIDSGSTATVYNAVGVKLETKQLSEAFTVIGRQFASGVYLVTVTTSGKSITKKIILN